MEQHKLISPDSECFKELVDKLVAYVKEAHGLHNDSPWLNPVEAKRLLGVSSNTTLQRLRNSGAIRFSQPMHKVILYDRDSINDYLEQHAKNTF